MALDRTILPLGAQAPQVPPEVYNAINDIYTALKVLDRANSVAPGVAYFPAVATITRGQAVNLLNGGVRRADKDLNWPAVGMAVGSAAVGKKVPVMLASGYVSGLAGLTPNSIVYTGVSGALLFASPGTGIKQAIGYALSATEIMLMVSLPT